MKPEKKFENKVRDFLKSSNCYFLKTWGNGVQRSGVPDLLICCNGYFVGCELKADNGTAKDLQKWNIKKIMLTGGIAVILYPDDYEKFIELLRCLHRDEWDSATKIADEINKGRIDYYDL